MILLRGGEAAPQCHPISDRGPRGSRSAAAFAAPPSLPVQRRDSNNSREVARNCSPAVRLRSELRMTRSQPKNGSSGYTPAKHSVPPIAITQLTKEEFPYVEQ